MKKYRVLLAFLALALPLSFADLANAQPKIGAIGDSLTDEHFDQTGFGINLGYSKNALELLVDGGQFDAGSLGNWGGTRGTGYEYNWALAGATTSSLISTNQHTNLANQIATAGITKAVLLVGSNDLFPELPTLLTAGVPGSNYESIYEGLATPVEVTAVATLAVSRVILAAQTIKDAGVDLVVAMPPDYGIAPLTKTLYPDPVKRERVDDVIEAWTRDAIAQLTTSVQVPVIDIYRLTKDIWGDHGSENATFKLGGVDLDLDGTGGVPYNEVLDFTYDASQVTSDTPDAFVHDGIHPNSTIGGIFANLLLTAFNQEHGDSFALFSEQEILSNAGAGIGAQYSSDTLISSLGGKTYSDYVAAAAASPGDFNADGSVDGADYLLWQRDTTVGDLSDWKTNYGTLVSSLPSAEVVPEPNAILLVLAGALCWSRARRA